MPWWVVPQAIAATNGALAGKVLIDVTNPLKQDYSGLEVGTDDSGGEVVQRLSDAKVVKAYNAVFARLVRADIARVRTREALAALLRRRRRGARSSSSLSSSRRGFTPVDAGPLLSARYTEPLVMLYVELGRTRKLKRDYTLTLIER